MSAQYLAGNKPNKLGNLFVFCWRKGQPFIVIGPDMFYFGLAIGVIDLLGYMFLKMTNRHDQYTLSTIGASLLFA